jgi:FtsP/CotA-like multicopper oxidase with cupredoxin domain
MSRTQRLALLGVAAVIAVLAIVVLPGDNNDNDTPRRTSQTEPAERAASNAGASAGSDEQAAAATPRPRPKPPLLRAGAERQLIFTKGERVRFRVRHSAAEEVHVHGYDIARDIDAGQTATISFPATIEGIFEVELEESGVPLGTIKVEPR